MVIEQDLIDCRDLGGQGAWVGGRRGSSLILRTAVPTAGSGDGR